LGGRLTALDLKNENVTKLNILNATCYGKWTCYTQIRNARVYTELVLRDNHKTAQTSTCYCCLSV